MGRMSDYSSTAFFIFSKCSAADSNITNSIISAALTSPSVAVKYAVRSRSWSLNSERKAAEAALFLADEQRSGYMNGQIMDLSGGQHMGRLPRF